MGRLQGGVVLVSVSFGIFLISFSARKVFAAGLEPLHVGRLRKIRSRQRSKEVRDTPCIHDHGVHGVAPKSVSSRATFVANLRSWRAPLDERGAV